MRHGDTRGKSVSKHRRLTTAILSAVLVLALALPAWAVQVSADCGGLGNFRTQGTANGWQEHSKSGHGAILYVYEGVQSRTRNYGFFSGTQFGNVVGNQLSSANAICPG